MELNQKAQGGWNGREMRLTHLEDGRELAVPWVYSTTRYESLGGERFQLVLSDDTSDAEIAGKIRALSGFKSGRQTLIDVRSWTPTLDA